MMKNGLFLLSTLASMTLHAGSVATPSEYSRFRASAGLTAAVLDETKRNSESFGYKTMLGYRAADNVLVEFGFADFMLTDSNDSRVAPTFVELSLLHPLSNYASFYLGGGGAFNNEMRSLTAKLGFQREINQNWYADIGYQGVFDVEPYNDDLYSFNFMIGYRFSDENQRDKNVVLRPAVPPEITVEKSVEAPLSVTPTVVPAPEKTEVTEVIEGRELCDIIDVRYEVQPGDYLYKIARRHKMSFNELLAINPQFNHRNAELIYPGEIISYYYFACSD